MAQYEVLRPIEYNGTLYLPKGAMAPEAPRSCGDGQAVAVNTDGTIELTRKLASVFDLGQIALIPAKKAEPKKAAKEPDDKG